MSYYCQRHNCAQTPAPPTRSGFFFTHRLLGVIVAQCLSVNEVAEEFGISPRTVRRYIATGRLTAYKVGPRIVRLDPDQVRRQLLGDSKT